MDRVSRVDGSLNLPFAALLLGCCLVVYCTSQKEIFQISNVLNSGTSLSGVPEKKFSELRNYPDSSSLFSPLIEVSLL